MTYITFSLPSARSKPAPGFFKGHLKCHRVILVAGWLLLGDAATAQEVTKPIPLAEAAKKVDQQVTVEFEVKSTGGVRNCYLNSAPDFSQPSNLTVFIPQAVRNKFAAEKIDKPEEYFYGRTIQVTGKIVLVRDKPQIVIQNPSQITVTNPAAPPIYKKTHVYKQVSDLQIRADSYRFVDRPNQPVVVWIHGGALINGHRESVPPWLMSACRDNGFVLVSLDYRLAPETQLPDIITDIEDAFRWLRQEGPELFQANPQRIAVVGGSAGGYLTLVTGYRVQPRPIALVSLWGYGDLVGPWYSQPSPHPRHQTSKLTRDEAYEQVSGDPVSDARERKGNGGAFYQFCRQQGLWPKAVAGWDPKTESEKFNPFMPIKNVSPDYPPTLLIHGDKDTDVPYEQSQWMAAEFKKNKVQHELITIAGGEHGLVDAEPAAVQNAYRAAIDFLRQHLNSP